MKWARRALLSAALPATKVMGRMHAPFTHKAIGARQYRTLKDLLRPGDVLLTRTRGEATNLFIPGFYTHAAIYIGDLGAGPTVIEAHGKGVEATDLIDFMLTKDNVGAVTYDGGIADWQRGILVDWAMKQVGKPYDYLFSNDLESFYCAELVYAAYKRALGKDFTFTLRKTMGEDTVTPQDIWDARQHWLPIFAA